MRSLSSNFSDRGCRRPPRSRRLDSRAKSLEMETSRGSRNSQSGSIPSEKRFSKTPPHHGSPSVVMLEFRSIEGSPSPGPLRRSFPFVRSFCRVWCASTQAAEQAVFARTASKVAQTCGSARAERRCVTKHPFVRGDSWAAVRPTTSAQVFIQFFGSRVPATTSIHKIGFRLYLRNTRRKRASADSHGPKSDPPPDRYTWAAACANS